jgi:hypothetical protein
MIRAARCLFGNAILRVSTRIPRLSATLAEIVDQLPSPSQKLRVHWLSASRVRTGHILPRSRAGERASDSNSYQDSRKHPGRLQPGFWDASPASYRQATKILSGFVTCGS